MSYQHATSLIGKPSIDINEDKSNKILVLGVGNYLMGDEGVGVHTIYEMEGMDLPEYLEILDGGTGGFFLMSYFDMYPTVIFVDACMDGNEEGHINLIRPKFASDFPQALSVHDVGLKDMIEVLYLQNKIPDIHLLTVSIKRIDPMTMELNEKVQESIPNVIDRILSLAKELKERS